MKHTNKSFTYEQIWFAFLGNLPVPMRFIHITTFPLQCIKISSIFPSRILHYHPQLFYVPRASKCFMIIYNWLLLHLLPVSYTHMCVEWEKYSMRSPVSNVFFLVFDVTVLLLFPSYIKFYITWYLQMSTTLVCTDLLYTSIQNSLME